MKTEKFLTFKQKNLILSYSRNSKSKIIFIKTNMECSICCEKFTKLTRKEIKCPSPECNESVCSACFKRYLMEGGDISPKCMFCSKEISYSYIRDVFPKSWNNKDYLDTRTYHLLSREKSLLPQSQEDVKQEIDRRERQRKANEIDRQIENLMKQISNLESERWSLLHGRRTIRSKQKIVTLRRCAITDCKGFLEEDWKCGICKTKACSQCGEKKGENHTCNEETKATFQLIKNDTRPCPKCAIPIHKWQGCNQMYCTQCSCMFDYRTGRLETGFFHNPHYFDALNAGTIVRREQNNNGNCLRFHDQTFLRYCRWFAKYLTNPSEGQKFRTLQSLIPLVNHIDQVTLQSYSPVNIDADCRIMRRKFLMDELTEEEWIKKLKVLEKKREKNREAYQLLELFKDVGRDILFNIGELYRKPFGDKIYEKEVTYYTIETSDGKNVLIKDMILVQIEEMEKITNYINEKFQKLEKQFGNKFPLIKTSWRVYESRRI